MKSNTVTKGLAFGLLILYLLWALFSIQFSYILISASVGLITYGSSESIEMGCVTTIFVGVMLYAYSIAWRRNMSKEGFVANDLGVINPGGPAYEVEGGHESPNGDISKNNNTLDIVNRIASITGGSKAREIKGMLSNGYMEGFADASSIDSAVPDAGSKDAEKKAEKDAEGPSASTKVPASVKENGNVSDTFKKDLPGKAVGVFQKDSAKTGAENTALFRLGSIPTDSGDGPHIDASSTLMNALNALKPDQIKGMTEDTRKLMETQQNLMGMLQSMKPMLQDGKKMMETFGTIFNK
jgi:hypothetical protein